MAAFTPQVPQVVVEYEFFEVPDVENFPQRVMTVVEDLIRRDRTPSDELLRSLVCDLGNPNPADDANAAQPAQPAQQAQQATRIRVMLPEQHAVDVAMLRSFEQGGNIVREETLTPAQIRILQRQSTSYRLRRLHRGNFPSPMMTRSRARRAHARPRSPERFQCVICMEPIRYRSKRIFLVCGHVYHRDCIVPALATLPRRCPSCRTEIVLEPEAPLEAEVDITV